MPPIIYARCERPLVHELDRLRRIVREHEIDFAVYDSIAFACDGPPESAEIAGKYFRAVRQIGPGSLHVAHVNKSDNGDQKPFGSAFWHNGSRMTWFAKLVDSPSAGKSISLGLFNRKSNLGRIQSPVGFRSNSNITGRFSIVRMSPRFPTWPTRCPFASGSFTYCGRGHCQSTKSRRNSTQNRTQSKKLSGGTRTFSRCWTEGKLLYYNGLAEGLEVPDSHPKSVRADKVSGHCPPSIPTSNLNI